jgi:hypothetical protein
VAEHSARTGTTTLTTTGATGGTFHATPAGLVIDATTGVIDLGASTPNTYDITYSFGTAPCTGTATSQVNCIKPTDSNREWRNILRNGNNNVNDNRATGGTFQCNTSRACDRCTTGVIDLGASTPNTYDITYSFGTAPCNGTATLK